MTENTAGGWLVVGLLAIVVGAVCAAGCLWACLTGSWAVAGWWGLGFWVAGDILRAANKRNPHGAAPRAAVTGFNNTQVGRP